MTGDPPLLPVELGVGVRAAFTTRGANLSVRGAVDVARARGYRRRLAAALGARDLAVAEQVHGAGVRVVTAGSAEDGPGLDALVTRRAALALLVFAADCMPVLLADPTAGIVAVAHAGRPGLVAGVLPATVAAMVAQGGVAGRITAVVGPSIGGCCYELPETLADAVGAVVPAARFTTTWGTPSIDLRAGADAVLAASGVGAVRHVGGCTCEQPERFYSYRRDGTADRHGGLVVLG